MNETIKLNVEKQLNDVRKHLKSRYENSIRNVTKNSSRKNNVEKNDDLSCSKNTLLVRSQEKCKNVIAGIAF